MLGLSMFDPATKQPKFNPISPNVSRPGHTKPAFGQCRTVLSVVRLRFFGVTPSGFFGPIQRAESASDRRWERTLWLAQRTSPWTRRKAKEMNVSKEVKMVQREACYNFTSSFLSIRYFHNNMSRMEWRKWYVIDIRMVSKCLVRLPFLNDENRLLIPAEIDWYLLPHRTYVLVDSRQ